MRKEIDFDIPPIYPYHDIPAKIPPANNKIMALENKVVILEETIQRMSRELAILIAEFNALSDDLIRLSKRIL